MSLSHRLSSARRTLSVFAVVIAVLVSYPSISYSSGFAIVENSASGMGSAFASGGAAAEDASSLYLNPASMGFLSEQQLSVAAHYIHPSAKFSNEGSTTASGAPLTGGEGDGGVDAIVPNLYYTKQISQQLHFGLAINAPFGLSTNYDDNWVGRYHAVKSDLSTININPSLSYRIDSHWLVGAGINAQYLKVEISSAIDFYAVCTSVMPASVCASQGLTSQGSDGFAKVTGNDWAYGLNFGGIYQLDSATRVAFAYRPAMTHHVDGSADFTVPANAAFLTSSGAFQDGSAHATLYLPAITSISMLHKANAKMTCMADFTLTEWSKFKQLRVSYSNSAQPDTVTSENWNNSWRISLGGKYQYRNNLALRAGIAYDKSPVPDAEHRTARIPDYDRKWISLGFNYAMSQSISLDFGYSHLFISNTPIHNTLQSDAPDTQATLNGTYTSSVDIASAQLNWNF